MRPFLAAVALFAILGFAPHQAAKVAAATTDLKSLGDMLDLYRQDTGSYPTTKQGLAALVTAPKGVKKWQGPYVNRSVPKDPWGNLYSYESKGGRTFRLYSFGADGRPGGSGDNADIDGSRVAAK